MLLSKNLTEEVLIWEYNTNQKSIRKIAQQYNCSPGYVRKRLSKFNITRRKNNEHYNNILHKQFHDLYVEELIGSSSKRKLWKCKCVCGNYIETTSDKLISGNTKTCGCAKKRFGTLSKTWNGYGEISSSFWSSIRNGARVRNIEFKVTIEEAWHLALMQDKKCSLSGIDLVFPIGNIKMRQYIHNASLDRIDSSYGYILDNIQWIDKKINRMKSIYSQKEFIETCKLVARNNLS